VKLRDSQLETNENEKNSSSEKKLEWGARHRVLKPEDSSRLNWVK
jgi:hypothetical protein